MLEEQIRSNPKYSFNYFLVGLGYARLGNLRKAEEMAEKAFSLNPKNYFSHALILSVIGRKEESLRQLELAIQNGWSNYIWMKAHIDLENLHDEARFQELLAQGLNLGGDQ
jgi:tetratricopeptide (TPR) repeat protein